MNVHTASQPDKKIQILETALALFSTQGLQQTSMSQVSKESGVAVGTMYHHFKSKGELIEGIFLHINQALGEAVEFTPEEQQLSVKERFSLILKKGYQFYVSHPNHFLFHDTHNYSPLISQDVRDQSRSYYPSFFDLLLEGIDQGIIVNMHPILLIRWIYNAMVSIVQIKLNHEIEVTEDMLDKTIEMTWKGLT
ncbi:TetR/AcrR family transcriptional regulator [Pontibacter sp. G13]|uniref:TetR/AcrR family transcriptional regulator n=1 Tax=Pontibacter sp. G13 TaxID=3074898 RepID=UPI00288B76B7|nr:TetR/AcrR family transcriptional regulator [Pontibacter sp. G13]WNJ19364.1 TetR/AcrR family transcriptional regulator [Pontibacter sp. G13]